VLILRRITLTVFLLIAGCPSPTTRSVLVATFNADATGSPPSPNQTVGTVAVAKGPGTVLVVGPLPNARGKQVQISHPVAGDAMTGLQGVFSQPYSPGTYGLLAVLYIPRGCGLVTLSFETNDSTVTNPVYFMHMDFMPTDTVRIDDSKIFGNCQETSFLPYQ
jgi:hypothetical protein